MEPTPALLYTTAIYDESIHPKLNFEKRLLIDFYDEIIPVSDRNFLKIGRYAKRYWDFTHFAKLGDSLILKGAYVQFRFVTLVYCGEFSLRSGPLGDVYMGRDVGMVVLELQPDHKRTLNYGIETSRIW